MATKKDLEMTLKEKISPLLEETMEKNWGLTIPKLESDLTDRLKNPYLYMYIPHADSFDSAKRKFKKEFLRWELQLHLGNVSQLSKMLGLDRRSIHRAIKELDIDMDEIRREDDTEQKYKENLVDQTIRSTLEQYKAIIHPQKMELLYQELPSLSRNIAKFLPSPELTWKEAEEEFERQFLCHALKENAGNIAQAAKRVKLRVETLHRKVKKLGLR